MDLVQQAEQFLAEHGRPLDQARFKYHFRGGDQAEVVNALAAYQNADGGFGHALEVDIQAPVSNPFATELALLVCLQAQVPPTAPLVERTVAFLEQTQEPDGTWRFSPEVYAHELAPWFQGWTWPNLNPSCTLAGLLRELGLGSARLHERVAGLFDQLAKVDDLAPGDFYSVRPYTIYFTGDQPHPQRDLYRSGVTWWLIRQHVQNEIADADHFFAYVRSPTTPIGRSLPSAIIHAQLDRLIAEQSADGGWPSPYNPAWRPWTTVQSLLVLQAFGRI